jgi:NADH-quinone oxidoreductase subunit M
MADLSPRELLIMVPIALAVLWMGIYPESFIAPIRADIAHLDARLAQAKPTGDAALTLGRPATHVGAHE